MRPKEVPAEFMAVLYSKCDLLSYHLGFYCFIKTSHDLDCQIRKKKGKKTKQEKHCSRIASIIPENNISCYPGEQKLNILCPCSQTPVFSRRIIRRKALPTPKLSQQKSLAESLFQLTLLEIRGKPHQPQCSRPDPTSSKIKRHLSPGI